MLVWLYVPTAVVAGIGAWRYFVRYARTKDRGSLVGACCFLVPCVIFTILALVTACILDGWFVSSAGEPNGKPNQSVAEKPQSEDASVKGSSTKFNLTDDISFNLNPQRTGTVRGTVHVHFLNPHFSADHEPFLVVWTDAAGYGGGTYLQADNLPERNHTGDMDLQYGKDRVDRVVKYSFAITPAKKGQFKIDGKTYDFAKGALFVVAGKEGDVRVKFLIRSKLPTGFNEVIAFGKADPEINAFFPDLKTLPLFSEAAKSK